MPNKPPIIENMISIHANPRTKLNGKLSCNNSIKILNKKTSIKDVLMLMKYERFLKKSKLNSHFRNKKVQIAIKIK